MTQEICLRKIEQDFPRLREAMGKIREKIEKKTISMEEAARLAAERTSIEEPEWEMAAARLRYCGFIQEMNDRRKRLGIQGFVELVAWLVEEELYGAYIPESYSRDELVQAETFLAEDRNELFTYSGLELLLNRYVIRSRQGELLETPQEMYLGIALHLAMKEKEKKEWSG